VRVPMSLDKDQRRRSRSTPDLATLGAPQPSPPSSSAHAGEEGFDGSHPLRAILIGAEMTMEPQEHTMVVYFEISVVVGCGQALCGVKRRYREFLRLHRVVQARYPSLLHDDEWGEHAKGPLPPFPGKTIFRPSWSPDVVTERVRNLGAWLAVVCQKLQYASPELISFLNVPMYCAIRMLSGDLQAADLIEPCSPDTVMADEVQQGTRDESAAGGGGSLSPHIDQRSLPALANSLINTVSRPGYNESALLVARAACSHTAASGAQVPTLDEAYRFVRAVCGRALFKPCSLIASVVYLERLRKCGSGKVGGMAASDTRSGVDHGELGRMMRAEGWQLVVLVCLVVSAKVWDSDYPISNADVCSPGSLPPAPLGAKPISMRRVNDCERQVLYALDYCTLVSPAEFARCYLCLPFLFPDIPLDAEGHSTACGVTSSHLYHLCPTTTRPKGGGEYVPRNRTHPVATSGELPPAHQVLASARFSAGCRSGSLP